MHDQALLLALLVVQLVVHALGWAMAAQLARQATGPQAHFSLFWALLAVGIALYVPAWPSGSAPRNLANLMVVAAVAAQHRGLSLFWAAQPPDGRYLALLAAVGLAVAVSLGLPQGHGWRVASVSLAVAAVLLATVRLVWRHGHATMRRFALGVGAAYGLMALALGAHAVRAVLLGGSQKVSIDAPRDSNALLGLGLLLGCGLMNLAQIRLILGSLVQTLIAQARSDPLTGVLNRRGLWRQLNEAHARAERGEAGYSVLMVDIDHFKALNDTHGHAVGDEVLIRVAHELRANLRLGDAIARWGGEEFCVLLPGLDEAAAHTLAERLVQRLAIFDAPRATVSVGVAEAKTSAPTAQAVLERADLALYRAKQAGRNRVASASC